jgi:hypothetical protein
MLKWAQRRDRLFITLDVQDATGVAVSLSEDALVFSGQGADSRRYKLDLKLYKPVDPKHQVGAALDLVFCDQSCEAPLMRSTMRTCMAARTANGSTLAEIFG